MQEKKQEQESLESFAKRLMENHPTLTKEEAFKLAKEARSSHEGGKSTIKL